MLIYAIHNAIHDTIIMEESGVMTDSDVMLPCRFKPDSLWSSSVESDSNHTDSQASLAERLGNTS